MKKATIIKHINKNISILESWAGNISGGTARGNLMHCIAMLKELKLEVKGIE